MLFSSSADIQEEIKKPGCLDHSSTILLIGIIHLKSLIAKKKLSFFIWQESLQKPQQP